MLSRSIRSGIIPSAGAVAGPVVESCSLKTRVLAALLLVATLPACARRAVPPTSLFPLAQAWRNPVAGGVDGALAADAERVYFVSGGAVHALRLTDGAPLEGGQTAPAR